MLVSASAFCLHMNFWCHFINSVIVLYLHWWLMKFLKWPVPLHHMNSSVGLHPSTIVPCSPNCASPNPNQRSRQPCMPSPLLQANVILLGVARCEPRTLHRTACHCVIVIALEGWYRLCYQRPYPYRALPAAIQSVSVVGRRHWSSNCNVRSYRGLHAHRLTGSAWASHPTRNLGGSFIVSCQHLPPHHLWVVACKHEALTVCKARACSASSAGWWKSSGGWGVVYTVPSITRYVHPCLRE